MKNLVLVCICIFISIRSFSQGNSVSGIHYPGDSAKPLIDSSAYNNWGYVDEPRLSNNGRYMCYFIKNRGRTADTTVLRECESNWELRIIGNVYVSFAYNGKMALFRIGDTLNVVELDKRIVRKFSGIKVFRISSSGDGEWIAFTDSSGNLGMRNLRTGQLRNYKFVKNYSFSSDGRFLILEGQETEGNEIKQSISLLNVASGEIIAIWKGKGLVQLLVDQFASRFAFLLANGNGSDRSLWYYRLGDHRPVLAVSDSVIGVSMGMKLDNISEISEYGDYIYFSARRIGGVVDSSNREEGLTIWSYLDSKLPTAKMIDDQFPPSYTFAVTLKDHRIVQISKDNELVLNRSKNGSLFLIDHTSGSSNPGDRKWSSAAQHSYLLRKIEGRDNQDISFKESDMIEVSPGGKYVVYYDSNVGAYFSYDVASGIRRNITSGLKVSWISYYREDLFHGPRGIAGWLDDDAAVLVYDRFDIWVIDPSGKKKPENFTNGYGLKHDIVFYLALPHLGTFLKHDKIILNALNLLSKENGFFQKEIGGGDDPQLLTMGNYIYQLIDNPYTDNAGRSPVKARYENKFIVLRMKSNESPNFFFTSDFMKFIPQSAIYPERSYNWYTTELHSWRKEDGSILQGVLYKPENFDGKKKYPIIFYYYEKKSFGLNAYIFPENLAGMCNINIPTFVSNGFLVFSPDIDYKIGNPMQGTYDAVVSSAIDLSKLPYVDSNKMGIGGCSFGGLQTNYLVTHTKLFAAAYSSSSISDLVSAYGDVPARYTSLSGYFENGQGRMGGSLWQKKDLYIKNSPIFNADRVATPLLLMHTTNDGICSFSQALEFFTALRRLGKKVWLLEYSDGNHGVVGKSADDFSIRLLQFFNHYLKDVPAPLWMTQGSATVMKKIDNGYKLDYNTKTPGKGLVIDSIGK